MPLTPTDLTCELRKNPVGIDSKEPRLAWKLSGDGVTQLAWQVEAGRSPEILTEWSFSGKGSDMKHRCPLPVSAVYPVFWRARVKSEDGWGPWSEVAHFVWGLSSEADWKGRWISSGRVVEMPQHPSLEKAMWIRHPDDSSPDGGGYRRWLRAGFVVNGAVEKAELVMSGDDQFAAWINGETVLSGMGHGTARTADVTAAVKSGQNEIRVNLTNHQGIGSLIGVLRITTPAGVTEHVTNSTWGVQIDENSPWVTAHESGPYGCAPWGRIGTSRQEISLPAACFRKEFTLPAKPVRAYLFSTALGLVAPRVNGAEASDAVLIPGWTDYNKRVHAEGADVTHLLKEGANCLSAILGDGWHTGYLAFAARRRIYPGEQSLRLDLRCHMADGSVVTIATDDAWKWGMGQVRKNDLLMGVNTDFREEPAGWDRSGYDDSSWGSSSIAGGVHPPCFSHPAGSPRREAIRPGKVIKRESSKVRLDFGRNIVGWVKFTVKGSAGQTLTIKHAEMIDGDELYLVNLRGAKSVDTFTLADTDPTVCEPLFTFHGFRYAEITSGAPFEVIGEAVAVVVHTRMARTFEFETGNQLLDALIQNSRTSLDGNGVDLFTDCPQRDERAGWTGDAQVYAKTSHYLGDVGPITEKWLTDLLADTQNESGALGDVAPHVSVVGWGNAGWEDAGIIVPYHHWEMTGDLTPFLTHRAAIDRFSDHLEKIQDERGLRPPGAYGDWLLLDGVQHSFLLASLYSSLCACRLAKLYKAAGDEARYRQLIKTSQTRRDAVLRAYQHEDGRFIEAGKESQSFYSLFIAHDLTTNEDEIRTASQHLVRLLKARDMKIATGFLGTSHLQAALQKAGFVDEAYQVLLNEEFPGWLFQIKCGATSMWERWDSWHPDRGFQDAGMNSFNHFWIGCVAEWMMGSILGIQPDKAGFEVVRFEPQFTKRLPYARGSYDSVRGRISSAWEWKGDDVELTVTIPPNTSGFIHLPDWKVKSGGSVEKLGPGRHRYQFARL